MEANVQLRQITDPNCMKGTLKQIKEWKTIVERKPPTGMKPTKISIKNTTPSPKDYQPRKRAAIQTVDYPKFVDIRSAPGSIKKLIKSSAEPLPSLTKKIIKNAPPRQSADHQMAWEYKTL